MSQISKCPRVTVVLSYWEASGEVSKLSYKSLLFDSSRRSYCIKSEIAFEKESESDNDNESNREDSFYSAKK